MYKFNPIYQKKVHKQIFNHPHQENYYALQPLKMDLEFFQRTSK